MSTISISSLVSSWSAGSVSRRLLRERRVRLNTPMTATARMPPQKISRASFRPPTLRVKQVDCRRRDCVGKVGNNHSVQVRDLARLDELLEQSSQDIEAHRGF